MLELLKSLGTDIARSGMFGCENESQGRVLALECIVNKTGPLSLPQTYHIMKGRLSMRADAMLGRFSAVGGEYQVIERSPEAAEISLKYKNRQYKQRFTWEDAQKEPFAYAGDGKAIAAAVAAGKTDGLKLSVNYSTPHKRMQMLWARVVSDCVRTVAPEIVCGAYTSSEVADYSGLNIEQVKNGSEPARIGSIAVKDDRFADVKPLLPAQSESLPATSSVSAKASDLQSASTEQKSESKIEPKAEPKTDAKSATAERVVDPICTQDQAKEINGLFDALSVSPENRRASLDKRGVKDPLGLTYSQAVEMIKAMKDRLEEIQQLKPTETGKTSIDTQGPITQELYDQCVSKIRAIAQGKDAALATKVSDKLRASGLRIGDLTYDQGRRLIKALDNIEIEEFFSMKLGRDLQLDTSASQVDESTSTDDG